MSKTLKIAWLSFIFNIAYGIYNAVIGIVSGSWWFITLSTYYVVLSVMRFAVLRVQNQKQKSGLYADFIKKFIGVMFIILAVTLCGTVYLSVLNQRGIKDHEILMITIALYTFIKITLAIINVAKSSKTKLPIIKTLRNIAFADAVVSVFSLQRSMLVSFEGMSPTDIRIFNILTGSAVCITVFILGLNLGGGAKYNMAKSKIVKANQKIAEAVAGGYKKVENAVVSGYTKIEDKFVDSYLTRDGETVEEAKKRIKNQQK